MGENYKKKGILIVVTETFGLQIESEVCIRGHRRVQQAQPTTRTRIEVFAPILRAQERVTRSDFRKMKQHEKTTVDPAQSKGEAGC